MDEQVYQQQVNQQPNWVVQNQEEPKQWLAIASFVLSLLGFNILWLIFGIIALNKKQLRRAALAGTIISAVKLVLWAFVFLWIFAGALIPRIEVARNKANDVARENNVRALSTAMMTYGMDNGEYPSSIANLNPILNTCWWFRWKSYIWWYIQLLTIRRLSSFRYLY